VLKLEAQVWGLVTASALLVTAAACNHHTAVDLAMTSAFRPAAFELDDTKDHGKGIADTDEADAHVRILAGDFHCHVSPPDWDQEANRDLAETVVLAKREHLDFVVLTPHVGARFFLSEIRRREELAALADLRDEIAKQGPDAPLLIAGFEYTDHRQGHLGFSFGDLAQVLTRLSVESLAERPQDFVSEWVASGGLVVVNHPLVTPLDSMFEIGRADLSWRPWTTAGPFPPEIEAANRLAQGFEAYNLTAAHMRDRYLSAPGPGTTQATLARIDQEILSQQRRLVPIGGSDSHEDHLRATTFVLASSRTTEDIRQAVLAGRVCVRDPRACSLRARTPRGTWHLLGAAFHNAPALEVKARGEKIRVLVNGRAAATPRSGQVAALALDPSICSVIRAEIDGGFSAPIYANCAFAQ
jgi:predicted metal-dependent phosphoesterase TrpH